MFISSFISEYALVILGTYPWLPGHACAIMWYTMDSCDHQVVPCMILWIRSWENSVISNKVLVMHQLIKSLSAGTIGLGHTVVVSVPCAAFLVMQQSNS